MFNLDGVLTETQLENVIEYLGGKIHIASNQDNVLKLEVLGDGSFNITLSDRNIYMYMGYV